VCWGREGGGRRARKGAEGEPEGERQGRGGRPLEWGPRRVVPPGREVPRSR